MVKISFLGGCREVGRSAVLVESDNGEKCILDYGVRFNKDDRLPYNVSLNKLKAIALTHCHIDHSGGLPVLFKNFNGPLYTNPLTLRITEILLKDMIKISNYPYPFGFREVNKLRKSTVFLANEVKTKIGHNFYITFFNAGHIPGSVLILVEVDNKSILYTGDVNTINTNLVDATDPLKIPNLDAIIIESTYALKEHPPRFDLEKDFIENIININENNGRVLIPAFGVARSQEILMILNKYNLDSQIYLDGLARKIGVIYTDFPSAFSDYNQYRAALKKARFVSEINRKKITKKASSIIISPSGMLKGGAAIEYIKALLNDPYSAIFLVGYQVEGTPGRKLLEENIFEYHFNNRNKNIIRNITERANCEVNYYDFSSHADKNQLNEYVASLNFKNNSKFAFCMHGDDKSTTAFARNLANKGFNSVAPETGETYSI